MENQNKFRPIQRVITSVGVVLLGCCLAAILFITIAITASSEGILADHNLVLTKWAYLPSLLSFLCLLVLPAIRKRGSIGVKANQMPNWISNMCAILLCLFVLGATGASILGIRSGSVKRSEGGWQAKGRASWQMVTAEEAGQIVRTQFVLYGAMAFVFATGGLYGAWQIRRSIVLTVQSKQ